MNYYALFYYVVENFITRRNEVREKHLEIARAANERGELLLAGAFLDPTDRTLYIFLVADVAVVEDFARNDPYVTSGLVTRWEVRKWAVAVGNE